MEKLKISQDPEVRLKFQTYPEQVKIKLEYLREIPERELKECIELALTYHLVKNKPLLGKEK